MTTDCREFFTSVVGVAAAGAAIPQSEITTHQEFPWTSSHTDLISATEHPIGLHSLRTMEEYLHALTYGPDSARQNPKTGI
jgi:hypothetical protein